MLYKSIISLALFGATFAAPVDKRQVATIQTAVKQITTSLTNLDTAIKSVQGPADTQKVVTASNAVQQALTTGTTMVNAIQPISLNDALGLQQTTGALTTQVMTTITDLTGKKAIIQQAGQTQTTLKSLQAQKTAADAFAKAVTAKVPAIAKNIASNQAGMVSTALQTGITAFGGAAAPAA
ncbi:hypothetical protein EJ08DRAFT_297642 [Tothia fuscella]|uniref:Uncharacterized protein n=1 Tax=Tothia fuscella TaxID=1048955 RepID=A0A9P4TWH9_9PEZI|nr:hypothetical protein EJ08DRAFT_297642 [Tothia fuscella]